MIKIVNKYSGAVIYEADFSNLSRVVEVAVKMKVFFTAAQLKEKCLDGADLRDGKFQRANFKGSSLEGVNAEHAVFDQACLKRTNFTGANLKNTSFVSANIEGAIMDGADPRGLVQAPDGWIVGSSANRSWGYGDNACVYWIDNDGHVQHKLPLPFLEIYQIMEI